MDFYLNCYHKDITTKVTKNTKINPFLRYTYSFFVFCFFVFLRGLDLAALIHKTKTFPCEKCFKWVTLGNSEELRNKGQF